MAIAEEFLEIAKKNLNLSMRTSANRLYFSVEKAAISYLLFKNAKVPKNPQKIWELSANLLGEKYYNLLRVLYDLRMQADYGNISIFADLTKENLNKNIFQAEVLIKKIKQLIGNK